jgi:signal transduction histidine kinase
LVAWTAYPYLFLKNPAILVLGSALLSASFRFGGNDYPVLRTRFLWVSIVLSFLAISYNAWGFFHRAIVFDTKLEFYVPVQFATKPLIQGSIVSIATVVILQIITCLAVLTYKYQKLNHQTKRQIANFLFAAFAILFLSFMDILVGLKILSNENYLFLLTTGTFLAVTVVILSILNQENVPSSVGFKIMAFNITLIYLVLSLIANILFNRYKIDFMNDFEREKDYAKTQIEKGTERPIVYQADIILEVDREELMINKLGVPFSSFENFQNRIPSYQTFKLEICFSDPNGIQWIGDFIANNRHYLLGLPYIEYRRKIDSVVSWLLYTLIITLLAIFLLYPILHKRNIILPLNRLLDGIKRMQDGDLHTQLEITTHDEIGLITGSFNEMIGRVRGSTENLELLVRSRTDELHQKLLELKNTQAQLLLSERLSTLGKIAANVAHEINNPLAAIKVSANFLKNDSAFSNITEISSSGANQEAIQRIIFENASFVKKESVSNFKRKKELTQFLSSVAFEDAPNLADTCMDLGISTIPDNYRDLFYDKSNREYFLSLLERKKTAFHLKIIETAIERASKIIFALKQYTYSGPKENKVAFTIKQGIDEVLEMYKTVWKHGVDIDVNLPEDIKILGYPDELVQVWTNLIHNAIQATSNIGSKIKIYSQISNDMITVMIQDNGHGIPSENLHAIFEPFFTTKEIGMGTGLGLSIVKKIIESHNGTIKVESKPGKTIFIVTLPIYVS